MSSARPALPDASARARIVTDLERSLLVEAGAGSGKTHELAARMAAGVAAGVYAIDQMAAVTFTRKAAAELRGRFQLALETEFAAAYAASDRQARIGHALAKIERFFAGTIHAFCARLLRERPVEAGVSPGFTELDDVEDTLLRRLSWRSYRAQERAAGNADLVRLDEAGIHAKDLDDAFQTVCLHEDVDFSAPDVAAPGIDGVWSALDAFWRDLESRLPRVIDPATKCKTQMAAMRFAREWRFASRLEARTPALVADLLRTWDFSPGITQKWWADDAAAKKAINAVVPPLHERFVQEAVAPYLTAWRQHLYAPCVRVLMQARDHAATERRRRNVLSFNDLLLLAARMLRAHADVREALQRKYRHLFIDEFQDTDPVQAEIMVLLGGPASTLFVVGDPKQSIYRFRRADIDVYNEMRARLAGADGLGVVALTTNFRSVPAICDWANRVFVQTFPAVPDDWQPAFAPLEPRPGVADAGPAIRTLTIEDTIDAGDVIDEEARRIARYVREEVGSGRRHYEDFLLLTRKKKRLLVYARAFEAMQIPIEVSGAGAFGASREVHELAALLSALADPQDGVALAGVLRGPLFGLSDAQLFAYRQAGGYLGLFSELPGAPDEARPVGEALGTLRRWFRWTRLLPAGGALDRVLEDSGYLALAASSPGGADAGDLLHAVDRIRAVVEAGFTLAEAAESIEDDTDESSEVESLPLEPGRGGVVRLMNLHKAKGLEAPVVFLADPRGGFEPQVDVRVARHEAADPETGVARTAVGWFPITARFGEHGERLVAEPAGWATHEIAERRYLDAEAGRLLYVAATRARELLVIGRHAKAGAQGSRAWAAFDPFLAGVPELIVPTHVTDVAAAATDLSSDAASRAAGSLQAAHALARRATWAATSVTAEIKRLPRITAAGPDEAPDGAVDDPTRVVLAETESRRGDAGVAWGSLVHGLLEHAMRHPSATRADLRRLALWLTLEDPALRVVVEPAIDTVLLVAGSDELRDAHASPERHAEVPFAVVERTETAEGTMPTVIAGTIDLVYRAGDAWRIVDYKTDVAGAASIASRYAAQVASYERAWSRVTSARVEAQIVAARA